MNDIIEKNNTIIVNYYDNDTNNIVVRVPLTYQRTKIHGSNFIGPIIKSCRF